MKILKPHKLLLIICLLVIIGATISFVLWKKSNRYSINSDGLWKTHYAYDKNTNTLIYAENLKNTVYMDLETGKKHATIQNAGGGGTCYACYYVPSNFITQGTSKLYSFIEKQVYDVEFKEIEIDDPNREAKFQEIQQLLKKASFSYYAPQNYLTFILINLDNKYYSYNAWNYPYDLSQLPTMQILEDYNNGTVFHASKDNPITVSGPNGYNITLFYTGNCFVSGCTDGNNLKITKDDKKIQSVKLKNSSIVPFVNGKASVVILGDKKIEKLIF